MSPDALHRTVDELAAGLGEVLGSPPDHGVVELIVRRPRPGERELLTVAELDEAEGLVGDCWRARGSRSRPDGSADPDKQVTIMNARAAALVAGDRDRWALAGDQLYVDLDLSEANLPAGTHLALGTAVVEITPAPHRGCKLFAQRFGAEAVRFVNVDPTGSRLRMRGINARVVRSGTLRLGDQAVKVGEAGPAPA